MPLWWRMYRVRTRKAYGVDRVGNEWMDGVWQGRIVPWGCLISWAAQWWHCGGRRRRLLLLRAVTTVVDRPIQYNNTLTAARRALGQAIDQRWPDREAPLQADMWRVG